MARLFELMRKLIEQFPLHIEEALKGEALGVRPLADSVHEVVVTGLGGSGIGGKVVAQWVGEFCSAPVIVVNDYKVPGFVDNDTLVIVCSYSGNTEETLSAFDDASSRGAKLAAITSGGELQGRCDSRGIPYLTLPPGNPPRSMFAYSSVKLIAMLNAFGLIDQPYEELLTGIAAKLQEKQAVIEQNAKELAAVLIGKTPVLYSNSNLEGVAVRWRQQINENGKMLCWHHVFPEMNHNELVGWENGNETHCVVMLRSSFEHPRTSIRMEISRGIFASKTPHIHEVKAEGSSELEQIYYLIHFGDWLSLHLAELTDTDPMDIRNIDFLKNELAAIP